MERQNRVVSSTERFIIRLYLNPKSATLCLGFISKMGIIKVTHCVVRIKCVRILHSII